MQAIEELGLTVESVFIPFSQSRNKANDSPSLNWRITLKRNGRDVLETDYMAGMAHCPSYNRKPYRAYGLHASNWRNDACAFECETGFAVLRGFSRELRPDHRKPIKPDSCDVIYSLTMDSAVLDSPSFEEWAGDFGFDIDSRSAESIYRACLEIALKLRASIGDSGIEKLQTAFADY